MGDYRERIKALYYEIYNLCLVNEINEKQLLEIFGEAEKDILTQHAAVQRAQAATASEPSENAAPVTVGNVSLAAETGVPVAAPTVMDAATTTSAATPLFNAEPSAPAMAPAQTVSTPSTPATNPSVTAIDTPLFNAESSVSTVVPVQTVSTPSTPSSNVAATPVAPAPSSSVQNSGPVIIDKPLFNDPPVPVTQTASMSSPSVLPAQGVTPQVMQSAPVSSVIDSGVVSS